MFSNPEPGTQEWIIDTGTFITKTVSWVRPKSSPVWLYYKMDIFVLHVQIWPFLLSDDRNGIL